MMTCPLYPMTSALLTEARLYAVDSIAHTMDYHGWKDQHYKQERITYGKFGQLWVGEFCKLNGICYEKDKSSPKQADDLDLKIGVYSVDVKTTVCEGIRGQVSPGVFDKPIDYYLFMVTDAVCSFVKPLGFVSQENYQRNAIKVFKGEYIPGTTVRQNFEFSYFLPYEIPVWEPFLDFMGSVLDSGESVVPQSISPVFENNKEFSDLKEKIDLLVQEKNNTNSLLLQLLDQTKSVKPIKRGNVVSINGNLFEGAA